MQYKICRKVAKKDITTAGTFRKFQTLTSQFILIFSITAQAAATAPSAPQPTGYAGCEQPGVPRKVPHSRNTSRHRDTIRPDTDDLARQELLPKKEAITIGAFRYLANGVSKKYPVHIIKDDAEHLFDGKVVVSLASMETLGVKAGDSIVAQVEIGGGIFGWEEI
jgi:hypothetical protein